MDTNPTLDFLRKKNKLKLLNLTNDEIMAQSFRAGGDVVCSVCNLKYYDHPFVENCLDQQDLPFLHIICDNSIVKL